MNGNLKKCKYCQSDIPKKAKVCPNCRKKQGIGCFTIILIVIGVFVVLCVLGALMGGSDTETTESSGSSTVAESSDTSTKSDSKKEEKKIKYTSYTYDQLFDDLNNNAARAEKNHQDEYIELTGYITNFDSDGAYIGIGAPEDDYDYALQDIQCYIKDDKTSEKLLEMNTNDKVTIKGQITDIGEVLGYQVDIIEVE